MQRDSKQRLLRYSGIVADCRVAFTVLKVLQHQWDASDEWLSMKPAARYPHQPRWPVDSSGVRLLICDRRILGVQRIFVVAPNLVSADKTNRKSAESRVGNVLRCHKLCEIRHAGAYVDLAAR